MDEATTELASYQGDLEKLEFQRMFSGQMDANCAYLDVQSGSGGTEAQDWAEMLLRMYLRWGEAQGFKAEIVECSEGEVAGISPRRSASKAPMPTAGFARRLVFIA